MPQLLALLFAIVFFQATGTEGFVCPPCQGSCDQVVHEKPGACPHCGMTLVRRGSSEAKAPPPAMESTLATVAILIFPGVQIIDYTGPYEVFGQAHARVFTVAATREPITT